MMHCPSQTKNTKDIKSEEGPPLPKKGTVSKKGTESEECPYLLEKATENQKSGHQAKKGTVLICRSDLTLEELQRSDSLLFKSAHLDI
jgi:hypothetical protein